MVISIHLLRFNLNIWLRQLVSKTFLTLNSFLVILALKKIEISKYLLCAPIIDAEICTKWLLLTGTQLLLSLPFQDLCSTVAISEQQLSSLQADVDQLQLKLHCQQPKAKLAAVSPTGPTPPPPLQHQPSPPVPVAVNDLIVLDDDVHEVSMINSVIVNNISPVIDSKIVQKPKSNSIIEDKPPNSPTEISLVPKQSSQEPVLSKSTRQNASVSKPEVVTPERKGKKADTFSFVDDLLIEHITFQDTNKCNAKSMEEKSPSRRKSRDTAAAVKIQGSPEGQRVTRSKKNQPVETNVVSDDSYETSGSPTF